MTEGEPFYVVVKLTYDEWERIYRGQPVTITKVETVLNPSEASDLGIGREVT
jgi:hypothetical protein